MTPLDYTDNSTDGETDVEDVSEEEEKITGSILNQALLNSDPLDNSTWASSTPAYIHRANSVRETNPAIVDTPLVAVSFFQRLTPNTSNTSVETELQAESELVVSSRHAELTLLSNFTPLLAAQEATVEPKSPVWAQKRKRVGVADEKEDDEEVEREMTGRLTTETLAHLFVFLNPAPPPQDSPSSMSLSSSSRSSSHTSLSSLSHPTSTSRTTSSSYSRHSPILMLATAGWFSSTPFFPSFTTTADHAQDLHHHLDRRTAAHNEHWAAQTAGEMVRPLDPDWFQVTPSSLSVVSGEGEGGGEGEGIGPQEDSETEQEEEEDEVDEENSFWSHSDK